MFAKDFRQQAYGALKGRWDIAVLTGLVLLIIEQLGSGVPDFRKLGQLRELISNGSFAVNDLGPILKDVFIGTVTFTALLGLIYFLVSGVLLVGYSRFNLNLVRGTNPQVSDLFSYFNRFLNGFVMQLLITIYTFLWTLLFIIPGIIAAYSYAMTPYILADHPDMSASEAIKLSKEMMYGHKGRLFCLQFSFIGWIILSALTCGIGTLFLRPYMEAANAAFYLDVSAKKG